MRFAGMPWSATPAAVNSRQHAALPPAPQHPAGGASRSAEQVRTETHGKVRLDGSVHTGSEHGCEPLSDWVSHAGRPLRP